MRPRLGFLRRAKLPTRPRLDPGGHGGVAHGRAYERAAGIQAATRRRHARSGPDNLVEAESVTPPWQVQAEGRTECPPLGYVDVIGPTSEQGRSVSQARLPTEYVRDRLDLAAPWLLSPSCLSCTIAKRAG